MAYTKNMTEGKPFPIIFSYYIPILCSTVFQQLYSIVDTIIVSKGPGSYTGIRIALTIAKTLAMVLNCEIVTLSSLEMFIKNEGKYV